MMNGLIQVKEVVWTGFSEGWQGCILFKIGHFGDISDLLKICCLKKHNSCKISGICLLYHRNIYSVAMALLCTKKTILYNDIFMG